MMVKIIDWSFGDSRDRSMTLTTFPLPTRCENLVPLFQEETTVDAAPKKKPSTLNAQIQSLLELICDLKAMEECVLELKFDTRKAPLGLCEGLTTQGSF